MLIDATDKNLLADTDCFIWIKKEEEAKPVYLGEQRLKQEGH